MEHHVPRILSITARVYTKYPYFLIMNAYLEQILWFPIFPTNPKHYLPDPSYILTTYPVSYILFFEKPNLHIFF